VRLLNGVLGVLLVALVAGGAVLAAGAIALVAVGLGVVASMRATMRGSWVSALLFSLGALAIVEAWPFYQEDITAMPFSVPVSLNGIAVMSSW